MRDGEVVDAIYGLDGRGVEAGTPADEFMWLTINDVIDEANNTDAASVEVDWPAGQDYPHSVYVDEDLQMADEERGYQVSDVVTSEVRPRARASGPESVRPYSSVMWPRSRWVM